MDQTARAKRAQGFESRPPQCHSCVHFEARRAKPTLPVHKYPRCLVGDFVVTPHSVCDEWRSSSGETLA